MYLIYSKKNLLKNRSMVKCLYANIANFHVKIVSQHFAILVLSMTKTPAHDVEKEILILFPNSKKKI
jgi:hypothetical protein